MDNFSLVSCYYTIRNNIDNKNSSVYMNDNPTAKLYLDFAKNLPSYHFLIIKDRTIYCMILLNQINENNVSRFTYLVTNAENNHTDIVLSRILGEITEKRASELIEIDESASVIEVAEDKYLSYNGNRLKIQPFEEVLNEVIDIANKYMQNAKPINVNIKEVIRNESIGGELDFNKMFETDDRPLVHFEGVLFSKYQFAVLMWGDAVKQLGIESVNEAVELWESIYERNMSAGEKNVLEEGMSEAPNNKLKAIRIIKSANVHDKNGELDEALLDYTDAIVADSSNLAVFLKRGHIYDKMGNPERAILDYSYAIDKDSTYAMAYFYRGFSHMVARKKGSTSPEDAIKDFSTAINLKLEIPDVFCYRADAYNTLGNKKMAIADYQRFLESADQSDDVKIQRTKEIIDELKQEINGDY